MRRDTDHRSVRSPELENTAWISTDGDAMSVHHLVMEATQRHEILDIVVTTDGAMVPMVQLHDRGDASRPGAGSIASVDRTTEVGGDGLRPSTEMKWVTVPVLEHREQARIAGQPTRCIATKGHAGGLEHIGGSGVVSDERGRRQQGLDRNMNDDLGCEARCLQTRRRMGLCEFAHAEKTLGPPLIAGATLGGGLIEIGGHTGTGGVAIGAHSIGAFGAQACSDGVECGEDEGPMHMIERCAQFDSFVVVEDEDSPATVVGSRGRRRVGIGMLARP